MFCKILTRYIRPIKVNKAFNNLNYGNILYNNTNNAAYVKLLYFASNIHTENITYNNKHAINNLKLNESRSSYESEREYLVKLKDDPDTFGGPADAEPELDPGDIEEEKYITETPVASQKLSTKKYADIIKEFLRKRRIKEAIDVLEVRMIKEDRVKPENYIYNLILGGCGRVGYTKKAFALYNDMKRRALTITPGTYTALFNACANSPWPTTDGLSRAKHLRSIMIEKMYEPNITNYNSMIKAFGRCGDLETAFSLVDEMVAKKIRVKDDTLNFLLQACITDEEAGFRHALLVWCKFVEKKIKPSLYSYNLMLRCIRDCGLGDLETTKNVINQLLSKNQLCFAEPKQRLIGDGQDKIAVLNNDNKTELVANEKDTEQVENDMTTLNTPNLMAAVPRLGNILSLSEVNKPEDRLLLVGGCSEFLQNMYDNNCTPDIKTFTQLLNSIPSTSAAESNLLQMLNRSSIKPDVDFFNMLIKKRSMRHDYEDGKKVLEMIEAAGFRPDLITYGVLALGCKTKKEAISLLDEMAEAKYRINIEILGGMLTQATYHNNFAYVIHIMDMCNTEQIHPGKLFLEKLENFMKKTKKISNDKDNPLSHSSAFQKGYKIFKMKYKTWLKEIIPDNTEDIHPWQQYRQTSDTNVKHYKDKDEKTRFKPIHTSLYKQKTSLKWKDNGQKVNKRSKDKIRLKSVNKSVKKVQSKE